MDIGISETDRKAVADGLSTVLADTYREFAALSTIAEPVGIPKANDMIRELVEGHEAVPRTARSVFPVVEAASDEPPADLLTQRLQVHEKTAWMLRSMLEDTAA